MPKYVFDHAGRPAEREVPSWQKPAPVRAKRSTRKQQPELLFLLGLFGAVAILFAAVTAPF